MDFLLLSSVNQYDIKWLDILLKEESVRRYLSYITADAVSFVNEMLIAEVNGLGRLWIIRLAEKGIGFIVVYDLTNNPFIFYAMLPAYRNKGYMKQAIGLIEKYYSFPLSTIVDSSNEQSLKILANTKINLNNIVIGELNN